MEYTERAASFFTEAHRSKEAYLHVRGEFNGLTDRFERAVRLPYLNKFGFNGLFRVNRSGIFNTPYGAPTTVPKFPLEQIEAASRKLARCSVLNGGFAAAMELARAGDVVYCDPPYLDSSAGASFTGYTAEAFGLSQHEDLLECATRAVQRGAHVMISNHDTPETRRLYQGWDITSLSVGRSISAAASYRKHVAELVAGLPGRSLPQSVGRQ
jgi:DNA adenine methylase